MHGGDITIKEGSQVINGTLGSGDAKPINIKANRLNILNKGKIINRTQASGNAGDIVIDAGDILMDSVPNFYSLDDTMINAGNIRIKANNLNLMHAVSVKGDDINIDATHIVLD